MAIVFRVLLRRDELDHVELPRVSVKGEGGLGLGRVRAREG